METGWVTGCSLPPGGTTAAWWGCGNGGLVLFFPPRSGLPTPFLSNSPASSHPFQHQWKNCGQAGCKPFSAWKLGLWLWVSLPGLSIPGVMMSFRGFPTSAFYALPQMFKCPVPSHSDLSLHATSEVFWLTQVATLPSHPRYHIIVLFLPFLYIFV